MDVVLMIIYCTVVLGILVFIHEGGHYLAARAFGVRVSEFMLGLPGPSIGFRHGQTRFGVTAVPLGGYARICGMEAGELHPHLKDVLASITRRGTANSEDVAYDCGISNDEALEALDELVEWGCVVAPKKTDTYNTYRTAEVRPTYRQIQTWRRTNPRQTGGPRFFAEGSSRSVPDASALFEQEYKQQYRFLPFWKRSVVLLAGVFMNLLFCIVAFVLIYSVFGIDYTNMETGEVTHFTVDPITAVSGGFTYLGMVVQAIAGLFNPSTAAETVSGSTSIVGIAVYSKAYAEAGIEYFLYFMAMISASLGLMNLLPIPPLDGGRFVVEVFQKITKRVVSLRVMNAISLVGIALFIGFFVIMMNQDIQRFIFGNW